MKEPMKISLGRQDSRLMTITFPSEKRISLTHQSHYVTEDQDEIDFASRLKGVTVTKLNDKEFRAYITNRVDTSVYNEAMSNDEADEFRWVADREELILKTLQDIGWVGFRKGKNYEEQRAAFLAKCAEEKDADIEPAEDEPAEDEPVEDDENGDE